MAVASTPTGQDFDRATRVLRATWADRPGALATDLIGSRDTLIRVPELTYPDGYEVEVTGTVVSAPGNRLIGALHPQRDASVAVVVRPPSEPLTTSTSSTSMPQQHVDLDHHDHPAAAWSATPQG
ncbi:MAG: hypothetical protein R2746_13080 [Acidimicrobiales bacterium]